jgi:hypothetical protein
MYPHVQQFESRRAFVDEELELRRLRTNRKPRRRAGWLRLMRMKSPAAVGNRVA